MSGDRAPVPPAGVDLDRPSPARVYDYCIGGSMNFAVDREFAKRMMADFPLMEPAAVSNRKWLARLVHAAIDAGHRQFLDLGSGVPSGGNVHEIVERRLGPGGGRVVYVDHEHVAVAHSRLILEQQVAEDWAGVVQADYRNPDAIFADETTCRLLEFGKPVCLIMASVLQFVGPADDPDAIVAALRAPLAPGSWFAASHPTVEGADPGLAAAVEDMFAAYTRAGSPAWLRTRAEVARWFDGLELVEPGIVHNTDWRPDLLAGDESFADVRPFYWVGVGEVPQHAVAGGA